MSTTATRTFTGTWQLDPVHSSVGFEVDYMAGTFKGEFQDIAAQLTVEGERARLEGSAKVASIDVKDENLTAHLLSPEFFDVALHPELRFTAEDIDLAGNEVSVRGEITIKGVAKPVEVTGTATAPMADPYGNDRIGLRLTAALDRTEFGLNWNSQLPNGEPALANEVRIVSDLQLVKQA
jgi:polyisoprenoid-binding protein YceI